MIIVVTNGYVLVTLIGVYDFCFTLIICCFVIKCRHLRYNTVVDANTKISKLN